jgi:hypothetical protein
VRGARSVDTWFLQRFVIALLTLQIQLSSLVLRFLLDFRDGSFTRLTSHNLAQLLLSDVVVAVGDQIFPDFCQCVCDSSVALRRWPDRADLNVKVIVQVCVFGVGSLAELFFLQYSKQLVIHQRKCHRKSTKTKRILLFFCPSSIRVPEWPFCTAFPPAACAWSCHADPAAFLQN